MLSIIAGTILIIVGIVWIGIAWLFLAYASERTQPTGGQVSNLSPMLYGLAAVALGVLLILFR